MTVTHSLAPCPKWYIADLVGRPLGGGFLATFSNLNPTALKRVFQDPAGALAWPYQTIPNVGILGIAFDENGAQGPFYFEFNDAAPTELYYLEVYDAEGQLQWTIDNFSPGSSGGGGVITEAFNLDNLITNSVMWRNIGSSASPTNSKLLKIAPGAHAGLAFTTAQADIDKAGPDICFIKNNTTGTDQITFPRFQLGDTSFSARNDVTPFDYFKYVCSNAPGGETVKCIQFPITRNVQNLTNQEVTVSIWAEHQGGPGTLTMSWFQFYGDGAGATSAVTTLFDTHNLSNAWDKYVSTTTIPSVAGGTLGDCGNDGLFLRIGLPLGAITDTRFTLPCMYVGDMNPDSSYVTNDMIDGVINAPRTGYIFSSFDLVAPFGYVLMNDGTIGSDTSGATSYANQDAFPLYNWLWTNVSQPSANVNCPVSGGLGASSVADFTANKPLALSKALGRALAGSGTGSGFATHALGSLTGQESNILLPTNLPANFGLNTTISSTIISVQLGATNETFVSGAGNTPVIILNAGGDQPFTNIQPTSYINYFIKL